MSNNIDPQFGERVASTFAAMLLLGALGTAGCQKSSVTETTKNVPQGAVPVATVTPVVEATPDGGAKPPVAVGRDGKVSNLPITVAPAKPAPTPAPDPFPARPTPQVVMKNGKIVQPWQAPPEALSLTNPLPNSAETLQLGREFYNQRCVDCHGKEGKGNGWLSKGVFKPPTNLASQVVQANSDGELFWKITNGKSPMPANRIRFTDEQRWQIVAYIRTFKP